MLLYKYTDGDFGYSHVELRMLPAGHPFANLLMHRGSRHPTQDCQSKLDLWQRYAKRSWTPPDMGACLQGPGPEKKLRPGANYPYLFSGRELGFRRETVLCPSAYGPLVESHLLLYHCIESWLAKQQPVVFEMFKSPRSIVGAVRLDYDEHGSHYILHNAQPCYEEHNTEDTTARSAVEDADYNDSAFASYTDDTEDESVDNDSGRAQSKAASGQSNLDPPVGLTAKGMHEGPFGESDEATADDVGQATSAPDAAADCYRYQPLKDCVMSCTEAEVNNLLDAFFQMQAHDNIRKYRHELMQRSQFALE